MSIAERVDQILKELEPKLKRLNFEPDYNTLRYFLCTGAINEVLIGNEVWGLVAAVEDILFDDASIDVIHRDEKRVVAIIEKVREYRGDRFLERRLLILERDEYCHYLVITVSEWPKRYGFRKPPRRDWNVLLDSMARDAEKRGVTSGFLMHKGKHVYIAVARDEEALKKRVAEDLEKVLSRS